jgi:hypothetical protein
VTRRTLRLTVAAALAALSLAGCQTYQGTAAYVGDTRITRADVDEQVDGFYAMPHWAEQAKDNRAEVNNAALRLLILDQLSERVVRDNDVKVPATLVDEVAAAFKEQPAQIPGLVQGASPELAAEVFTRVTSIIGKPANQMTEQDARALLAALQGVEGKDKVKVNPRYGTFVMDAAALQFAVMPRKDAGVRDLEEAPPLVEEPQPDAPPPGQQQPN